MAKQQLLTPQSLLLNSTVNNQLVLIKKGGVERCYLVIVTDAKDSALSAILVLLVFSDEKVF